MLRLNAPLQACYALKSSVERIWKRIPREADDYIANPKGFGGYQSLHTAVTGEPRCQSCLLCS